jgi:hypothetical protein
MPTELTMASNPARPRLTAPHMKSRLSTPINSRNRKIAPGVLKSRDIYDPRMIMFPKGAPMARKKLRKIPTQNPRQVSASRPSLSR